MLNKLRLFFHSKEWKLLWSFYTFEFLWGVTAIWMPIYVLFFQERGLTLGDIAIVFIAFRIGKLIFEVPTGVVADVYGRKFSTLLGVVLSYLVWIAMAFSSGFEAILVLYFLMGVFVTLITGAEEAWAYDWLKYNKSEKLFTKLNSRGQIIAGAGYMIAPLIGGLLATKIALSSIIIISGILGLIITGLRVPVKDEHFVRGPHVKRSDFWRTLSSGMTFVRKTPLYLYLIVAATSSSILFAVWSVIEQPFLFDIGVSYELIGLVISAMAATVMIGPMISLKMENKLSNIDNILVFGTLSSLLFISVYFIRNNSLTFVIPILLFAWLFYNVTTPFFLTETNKLVPSKVRATVGSVRNMFYSTAHLIGFGLVGIISEAFGVAAPILILIPAGLYGTGFYLLYRSKSKNTYPRNARARAQVLNR
jgi:MFS family permease